jgi:hypothetical protein
MGVVSAVGAYILIITMLCYTYHYEVEYPVLSFYLEARVTMDDNILMSVRTHIVVL